METPPELTSDDLPSLPPMPWGEDKAHALMRVHRHETAALLYVSWDAEEECVSQAIDVWDLSTSPPTRVVSGESGLRVPRWVPGPWESLGTGFGVALRSRDGLPVSLAATVYMGDALRGYADRMQKAVRAPLGGSSVARELTVLLTSSKACP